MKKKFIIWGHKSHRSNTFYYVNVAFLRAFEYKGWKAIHLDNSDDISNMSFEECIFFTEGQADQKIPILKNAKYILHNCNLEKYADIPSNNILKLQVFTNGKQNSVGHSGEKINEYTYFDSKSNTLYQPWATDLLPSSIDQKFEQKLNKQIVWCGTIAHSGFSNHREIGLFLQPAHKQGYKFFHFGNGVSFKDNIDLVKNNELSPTIVGTWQKVNDYIPCRIFKNISYGGLGITNSAIIKTIFQDSVIYSKHENKLFETYKELNTKQKEKMFLDSCNIVTNQHTYINRIDQILELL